MEVDRFHSRLKLHYAGDVKAIHAATMSNAWDIICTSRQNSLAQNRHIFLPCTYIIHGINTIVSLSLYSTATNVRTSSVRLSGLGENSNIKEILYLWILSFLSLNKFIYLSKELNTKSEQCKMIYIISRLNFLVFLFKLEQLQHSLLRNWLNIKFIKLNFFKCLNFKKLMSIILFFLKLFNLGNFYSWNIENHF